MSDVYASARASRCTLCERKVPKSDTKSTDLRGHLADCSHEGCKARCCWHHRRTRDGSLLRVVCLDHAT
jgi:hypothetical protein